MYRAPVCLNHTELVCESGFGTYVLSLTLASLIFTALVLWQGLIYMLKNIMACGQTASGLSSV